MCLLGSRFLPTAKVAELYEQWLEASAEVQALQAERNAVAKQMKGKLEDSVRQELIAKGSDIKKQLATLEASLGALQAQLDVEGRKIPNMTHPAVPRGSEEEATATREVVGAQRDFGFAHKTHVELAEALDLVDFEAAAEVSGSKFYYLKNAAALLELALVNYAMAKCAAAGFTLMTTPDLVRDVAVEKCGFQPRMANTQVYSVENSDLCLAGTAEIPLGGVYGDQILDESVLPVKMAAFGHCFRTEAGAAGAATKGLYRVHQFSKVEMFVLATPEQSDALHEELIELEKSMYEELGLHFKVLDMPTGDLGAPAYRKYDVEAWMPGLNRYGEISSASNCTEFQARRLNIRYRPSADAAEAAAADGGKGGKKGGKKKKVPTRFVHTLNATAVAVPRMIICILENFQNEDGSVDVPEALQPFMGGLKKIEAK